MSLSGPNSSKNIYGRAGEADGDKEVGGGNSSTMGSGTGYQFTTGDLQDLQHQFQSMYHARPTCLNTAR